MTSHRLSIFVEDLVVEVSNNRNLFHIFECVLRLHRLDERSHGRCPIFAKNVLLYGNLEKVCIFLGKEDIDQPPKYHF